MKVSYKDTLRTGKLDQRSLIDKRIALTVLAIFINLVMGYHRVVMLSNQVQQTHEILTTNDSSYFDD